MRDETMNRRRRQRRRDRRECRCGAWRARGALACKECLAIAGVLVVPVAPTGARLGRGAGA